MRRLVQVACAGLLVTAWFWLAGSGMATWAAVRPSEGEPEPETGSQPVPITDRLAAPPMPANPTQADYGQQVYYQVCMACHGDRGQGLTEEWRAVWEEDSYCWLPECHGPKHPPQGFEFPQVTSPVIGPNTLTRFNNALELYTYTVETMPWWNPGYLKAEEFWQVTAFLLRAHGGLPEGVELSEGNAVAFNLHPSAPLPGDARPAMVFVAATLAAAGGLLALQERLNR